MPKIRFLDIFVVFRLDIGQISFNLVENAFVTRQLAPLATSITFYDILARVWAKIKYLRGESYLRLKAFRFFFSFDFPFSPSRFFFAAVTDLLLGLLAVEKIPRKGHRDGQFLPWSSQVSWQEILPWVFHWTFSAFLCISQAPLGWLFWSGHHWKDLFLLQKLNKDDANFGQKWWRQKWKKGQGSSRPVAASTGVILDLRILRRHMNTIYSIVI